MFLFVILADFERGHLSDASNQHVFLPSSSSSADTCRLFFGLGGTPGSVRHFSVRCLGGEYLLLARPPEATPVLYCTIHSRLSNRSASLWRATRQKLVLVDVVLLEGWFHFFFSWRCFFLWRFGCGDVGRFIFLWEKKGYIPRRFIFHEKNVNIFRNWKDSNFLLQAPWGFFWGECWEDFSPRK